MLPDRNSLKRMRYMNLVFKEGMFVPTGIMSSNDVLSKIH